ncbi:hypothetical protein ABPG74_010814 [Tetrahymena malaccensis]
MRAFLYSTYRQINACPVFRQLKERNIKKSYCHNHTNSCPEHVNGVNTYLCTQYQNRDCECEYRPEQKNLFTYYENSTKFELMENFFEFMKTFADQYFESKPGRFYIKDDKYRPLVYNNLSWFFSEMTGIQISYINDNLVHIYRSKKQDKNHLPYPFCFYYEKNDFSRKEFLFPIYEIDKKN